MTEQIDLMFTRAVEEMRALGTSGDVLGRSGLTAERCLELFDSQLGSRHLDLAARWLRGQGKGYYTIGSSGHEGNAAVAAALRSTDPALLHYRSGAFFLERARQAGMSSALRDVLLGVVAATEDPISGGRHKVFGSKALAVIPQTSTIASHLPRALGIAMSIHRARKLGVESAWPEDAVTVCSFGDASVNHSTATGAINAAIQASFQGLPIPLLFVCEDNGIGISVPTPQGWIAHNFAARRGLRYFEADGCDLVDAVEVAAHAANWVRRYRSPAFLHLRTVRFMGHAGSDVETAYRTPAEILAEQRSDPLVATARLLVTAGVLSADDVLARYEAKRAAVLALAREVADLPQHMSAETVIAPLAGPPPAAVAEIAAGAGAGRAAARRRHAFFGAEPPEREGPLTLAQSINRALADVLAQYPEAMVFGEDVARKGGCTG